MRLPITVLTVVFAGFLALTGARADVRPNLIFLLSDDQNTLSMGCYGNPDVQTPNLDRLAADGMVFDRHYVSTAICMASRATAMTGLYEYRTGCNFNHGALLRERWEESYPILLREAGYRTAFAGKFGFEVTDTPGKKGVLPMKDFDRWGGGPGQTHYETAKNKSMAAYAETYPHSTRAYGAFGRDFIKDSVAAADGRPFCLSISFKAPHRPVDPDPTFDHVYADKTFSRPNNYGRENGEHFSKQSRQGRQYERFESWDYDKDYDGVMAKYYQQIYAIDVAVGMIREALEEAGVADNTVIVYTSDNGFMCGSHGYGSKVLPYEESSRVPLILYLPGHANSGKRLRCGALTGNVDFAPTLLELAGVSVPEDLDGRSLLPLYDDPEASIRDSLSLVNVWGPKPVWSLSVVTRDWKYIYWPWAEGDFEATEELYHLAEDPLELTNLSRSGDAGQMLRKLRGLYDAAASAWRKQAVEHHGYAPLADLFQRDLPWEQKRSSVGLR